MFKHILVPLDGSSFAEAALPAVVEIAARFGSKITLFQVIRPPFVVTGTNGPAYAELLTSLRDQTYNEAKAYLEKQRSWLRHRGFNARIRLAELEPVAEAILDTAEQSDVDAIIMSTHGRGGVSRWVYGSVADKVLRYATVPVLLIRVTDETVEWPPAELPEAVKTRLRPEEESAELLERKIKLEQEPSLLDRMVDEHTIDHASR